MTYTTPIVQLEKDKIQVFFFDDNGDRQHEIKISLPSNYIVNDIRVRK